MNSPILARKILEEQVIKFGAFKLKLHETQPEAPLSPIYLSFRKPPKGPLADELIKQLGGGLLYGVACMEQLKYRAVCGVPEAGEPFAIAFAQTSRVPHLWLDKEESGGKRRIVRRLLTEGMAEVGVSPGERILVIDDLITRAHSKLEAIEALRSGGLVVEDVLVLVDREQGGRAELKMAGVSLYAAWQMSELLSFYLKGGLLEKAKYEEIISYLAVQRG